MPEFMDVIFYVCVVYLTVAVAVPEITTTPALLLAKLIGAGLVELADKSNGTSP